MKLHRHLTANEELLERFDFKRELSMESYLIENEGVLALDDDTYSEVDIIEDELTLKRIHTDRSDSFDVRDGRIDILATYSNEVIAVIELKLGELNEKHLEQLENYLKSKDQILDIYPNIIDRKVNPDPKWLGVLVGSSIEPELAAKISKGYTVEGCDTPIAALTIKRFKGSNGGVYVTTDVVFHSSSSRDFTKYRFNGEDYGKGRLVLAVMKEFVENNPKITYASLEKEFSPDLQGSQGVFRTKEDAEKIYLGTSHKRHFLRSNELIELSDSTIAVSNQWGAGNIDRFIKRAIELKYKIDF